MGNEASKKMDIEFQLEEIKEVEDQSSLLEEDVASIPDVNAKPAESASSSDDDEFELEITPRAQKSESSAPKKIDEIKEKTVAPVLELGEEELQEAQRINQDEKLEELPDLTTLSSKSSSKDEPVVKVAAAKSEASNPSLKPIAEVAANDIEVEEVSLEAEVSASEQKIEPESASEELSESPVETAAVASELVDENFEEAEEGFTTVLTLPKKTEQAAVAAEPDNIKLEASSPKIKAPTPVTSLEALIEDEDEGHFNLDEAPPEEFRPEITNQNTIAAKTKVVAVTAPQKKLPSAPPVAVAQEFEEENEQVESEVISEEVSRELESSEVETESEPEMSSEPDPIEEPIEESIEEAPVRAAKENKSQIKKEKVKSPVFENVKFEYDENEMLKLQATIRHLRDERESVYKDFEKSQEQIRILEKEKLTYKAELDELKIENTILKKRHADQLRDIHTEISLANEKKSVYESKIKQYQLEIMKLNEKVKTDVNKVRNKEKDLEGKLEILTMDTASQIQARDQKIMELKRKIDSMEFNMESAISNEKKAKQDRQILEDRLNKVLSGLKSSLKNIEEDMLINGTTTLEAPISKSDRPVSRMKKA